MRPFTSISLGLLLALSAWQCAGSSGGGDVNNEFVMDLGVATNYDAVDKTRRLFDRYQYDMVREEQSADSYYFESRWKVRAPLADEQKLGIIAAQTRIIVRAKPRTRYGTGMAPNMTLKFYGETEVQFGGSQQWTRIPITNMQKKFLKDIANGFKLEFEAGGLRKY